MRPVFQTKFGRGRGDCLVACVASILERPLESIPDFNESGYWFENLYQFCLSEGIGLIYVHPKDLDHTLAYNAWCIMSFAVDGVDDENHAVIGRLKRVGTGRCDLKDKEDWKWIATVEFDPNPRGVNTGDLEHIMLLIPGQVQREVSA